MATKKTEAKKAEGPKVKVGTKVLAKMGRGTFPGKVTDISECGKWCHVEAKEVGPDKRTVVYLRRIRKLALA